MPFWTFLMAKTGGRKNDTTERDAANGWSKNRHANFSATGGDIFKSF